MAFTAIANKYKQKSMTENEFYEASFLFVSFRSHSFGLRTLQELYSTRLQ